MCCEPRRTRSAAAAASFLPLAHSHRGDSVERSEVYGKRRTSARGSLPSGHGRVTSTCREPGSFSVLCSFRHRTPPATRAWDEISRHQK